MQQSIDPLALGAALAQQIKSAVEPLLARIAALESREPQRGEKGDRGESGKDGRDGEKGADGLSIAGAFIQNDGHLVLVQSDGTTKDMGEIVGRDGIDGKDGAQGKDGKDGESLSIVERSYDAESHEIIERYISGGEVKTLRYPAGGIVHKGYWGEGKSARAGDAYTHNGCLWIAQKATDAEPSPANDAWCVGARKGRDGKDFREVKNEPVKLK